MLSAISHSAASASAPARFLLTVVAIAVVLGGVLPAAAQVTDQVRLKRAVDHLLASQLPSGLFRYDFDFLAARPVERDNVVRQAGTAYFLAEYYLQTRDERVRRAVEAALTRLGELSLPIGKSPLQAALEQTRLLSLPMGRYKLRATLDRLGLLYRTRGEGKVISLDGTYDNAFTGAIAVALLAELHYHQATADNRFGPLRSAWLTGLLSLRIPGRGVRVSPGIIDETPFFDGEAWLALAHYDELFPRDDRVVSALEALDTYLMRRYADEVFTGFYQWGTMAAARRLSATSKPKFLSFVRAQAERYLARPRREPWRGDNSCAYMEGLATAARVLRAHKATDGGFLERIEARLHEEMEDNRRLQIPPNITRMTFAEGVSIVSPHLRDFSGAFLEGRYRPYTRIDATGHCVSALLKLGP